MRRLLPCMSFLLGCNFHDGVKAVEADAPVAADAPPGSDTPDIDAAPPSCMDRWLAGTIHFDTPVVVGGISSPSSDRDDFLSADELTIYWASYRAPSQMGDVWVAKRTAIDQPFGNLTRFTPANDGNDQSKLGISDDTLYFVVASPAGSNATDIYDSFRSSTNSGWSGLDRVTRMQGVNSMADELDPFLTPDGLGIYFARTVGARQQIFTSTRSAITGAWGTALPVVGITTDATSGDADPAVSSDGRVLLFTSNRPNASNDTDLWYATRANTMLSFGTPTLVPDVNVDMADEGDPWLSRDGCRLYFVSTRVPGNSYDIYVATATPP